MSSVYDVLISQLWNQVDGHKSEIGILEAMVLLVYRWKQRLIPLRILRDHDTGNVQAC